ncbi:MAG: YebC/PmpR family DNA-binding transcriptional regulator, partial [Chitinophagaceae bacterium]
EYNPTLRRIIQNAKAINMPKDRIDSAIKRAVSGKDTANYEEILYEGFGPFGIAILVETTTDNNTRTVATLRSYFNKFEGSLGTSGSVSFMFQKMGCFKLNPTNISQGDLELELIDYGLEEMGEDSEGNLLIRCIFNDFGTMQKAIEKKNLPVISAESEWIPTTTVKLNEDELIFKLIDLLEEDEDVQKVFHNLK